MSLEKFNHCDYKTTIKYIHYDCKIDGDQVIWSEYGDDPHGLNEESSISLIEFLAGGTWSSPSERCKAFIKTYFGNEKLECFIYFVQQQYHSLNK